MREILVRATRRMAVACSLATAGLWAVPACAEDEPVGWQKGDLVFKAGVAGIFFNSSATIKLNGTEVAGASAHLTNNATPSFEVEYFPARDVSVALLGGIPPKNSAIATGTLSSLGTVGRIRYGLGVAVVRYHANASGRLSPFAGVGVGRFFIFSTEDGSLQNLHANSGWGPFVQAGADYHFNRHWGLQATVAFLPIKSDASGTIHGAPVTARTTINPMVVKAALSYRF